MDTLKPNILQNIAKFLSIRELFSSFEPVSRSTKEVVNELCRQMKTLNLCEYSKMTDSEFISLMRRCCDVTFLSLDYLPNMIACNQDLWEVNIYCPKLYIIVIHGSPIFANEFANEVVARLAAIDASIPTIYTDPRTINVFHMFCSARLVHLVSVFNIRETPVTTRAWSMLKYLFSTEGIVVMLQNVSLDQLVACAFYAVCRLYSINVTFQNILEVYTMYLLPFQQISSILEWGDVKRLWFDIDLQFVTRMGMWRGNETWSPFQKATMVELYNCLFVPYTFGVINYYHSLLQGGDMRNGNVQS